MNRIGWFISATVLLLGAPAASADVPKSVFILPVGGDAEDATVIIDLVASDLTARGAQVLTQKDLDDVVKLEADKQALGCDDNAACLADLASRTDVERVLSLRVGKVGTETLVTLALIDPVNAAVLQRVSQPLDKQKPSATVRQLTGQVFGEAGPATFTLPEGTDLSFAVLDLEAAGISEDVAKNLTQVLSTELKKIEGATVIGRDDIRAMVQFEGEKQALGCSDDTGCLAELGNALGVARIVVGQVGKVADNYIVSLRLIDTETVTVENRVTETYRGQEAQLLGATRFAAQRLFGLDGATSGAAMVSTTVEGATLFVDGKEVGALPGPPVDGLIPGRHEIRVKADGYYEYSTDIYVAPGDNVTQWVELEELPAAFYQTWQFWTVAGATGAAVFAVSAAVAGAGTGYLIYESVRPRPLGAFKVSLPARGAQ